MIKLNKRSECEICGNSTYLGVESSILIDRYPFITKKNLVECSKCGARFIICSKCGSIFNRVHLALDIFQIKVKEISITAEDHHIMAIIMRVVWKQDMLKPWIGE